MILILDNMEHLLGGGRRGRCDRARVADEPVHRHEPRAAPDRRRARIRGRVRWSIGVTDLFIERARAIRVGWQPADDEPVIAEICRSPRRPAARDRARGRSRVGPVARGHPRPAGGPPAAAGQRTSRRTGAPADARRRGRLESRPPRLPIARTCFIELGVFEGGFDLEQVDAVVRLRRTAALIASTHLLELADQSLIVAAPTRAAGRDSACCGRSSPSPSTGWRPTAIEADVRRRHAEAFLALATQVSHRLNTSRHGEWLDRMAPEQANLRSARALVDRRRGGRSRPSSDRGPLAVLAGLRTGGRWSPACRGGAGDARGADERIRPRVGARCGRESRLLAGRLGHGPVATTRLRSTSPRRPAMRRASPTAYFNFGHVAFIAPRTTTGVQLAYIEDGRGTLSEARRRARCGPCGLGPGHPRAQPGHGDAGHERGRIEEATAHLREGARGFERLDDRQYHAMTEASLAWAAFAAGDVAYRDLASRSRRSSSPTRCGTSGRRRSRSTSACCSAALIGQLRGGRGDPRRLRCVVRAVWRPPAGCPRLRSSAATTRSS